MDALLGALMWVLDKLLWWTNERRVRPRAPELSEEDRAALAPRLLLHRAARRGKWERKVPKYWLRRRFREVEQLWVRADIEVAECAPVRYEDAEWRPEVSKVANGVMVSLHCSKTGLLTNIACRVDDQQSMKHRSATTGPLAYLEVRFKWPRDFDTAPAVPSYGEWLEASWIQPHDEPEEGVIDPGLGREIVTCRFRVVQTSAAIS